MCRICPKLKAAGVPPEKWPNHAGPVRYKLKRKKPLDERIAAMKARHAKAAEVDNLENRRQRLRAIREALQVTEAEFAELVGTSARFMNQVLYGAKKSPTSIMILAEQHMANFRRRQKREDEATIPANIPEDSRLRERVLVLFHSGKSEEDIARELALRLEVVHYWVLPLTRPHRYDKELKKPAIEEISIEKVPEE